MRLKVLLLTASLLTITALLSAQQPAPEPPSTGKPEQKSDEAMMAAYLELAKPTPEHAVLDSLAGTWDQTLLMWMSPDSEPLVIRGTGENEWILGKRFMQMKTRGGSGTTAYEGLTVAGFDRRTAEYTLVGFDTWGTYYVTAAGKQDPKTKSIHLEGSYEEPIGGTTMKYRWDIRILSRDENIATLYFLMPDGTETRASELRSVRKK